MATGRTHAKSTGAPDYDNPEFWDVRFATGQDVGEWLNSGEVLLEAVLHELERRPAVVARNPPRVLHLGPGISQLGGKLRDACVNRQWLGNGIVNVDFSAEAVRLGQEFESQRNPNHAMPWLRIDLRSWHDASALCRFAPFDVILDKSTSDAIATAGDQIFSFADDLSSTSPTVREILSKATTATLPPVELLALQLVPLTRKGTTWIALSYSATRFDNLPYLMEYWTLCSRTPLKAPPGPVASTTHTPDVFHWIYVMKRK